ncbi:3'-5' exonuclease [Botrytis cinerea]
MSINIEYTFQVESIEDLQNSVEISDEDEHTHENEDTKYNPFLEWAVSWSYYVEEMLAEKERDLILCNENSSGDCDVSFAEFDWDTTHSWEDFWPQSDYPCEIQPVVSLAEEYETRMAALDQKAEEALNTDAKRSPDAPTSVILIDTLENLDRYLPVLSRLKDGVELAFDCEGTPEEDEKGKPIPGSGFGRTGDISFLPMSVISIDIDITYVFDVWQLKTTTFECQSDDGLSLKQILELNDRIQLWWDVRSDWDTLFHKFGIQVGKVRDVKLKELLSRFSRQSNIFGLHRVRRNEGLYIMSPHKLNTWPRKKTAGGAYSKRHGWRPVTTRPLTRTARNYIAGDTECLFGLHKRLYDNLENWLDMTQGKTVRGLMDVIGKPSMLLATLEDLMQFIDQQSMIRAQYAIS